jgi:NADPH:quinone reductase-like Zn-dependent oxidoreductase
MNTAAADRAGSIPTTTRMTMRAVIQTSYGTAPQDVLRYGETTRPTIGDDQVLIRVAAASVDQGTWHVMAGRPFAMRAAGFGIRAPKALNPGRNLAGTVEAVGANVTDLRLGDEVFGTGEATFAEYARAKPSTLAIKPGNLTFEEAAAVPVSALAASSRTARPARHRGR